MVRFANWFVSLTRSALGAIVFGLVLCGPAWAVQVEIVIDENGNGTINGSPNPGVLALDPAGGMVLTYPLPLSFVLVPGDVELFEPGGSVITDVIRFSDGVIRFYSDNLDGSDADLADRLRPLPLPLVNTINEEGPEGNNGALYTPGAGTPGHSVIPDDPNFVFTYHFISDAATVAVAEPSPVALLLLGLGMMAFGLKRRGLAPLQSQSRTNGI